MNVENESALKLSHILALLLILAAFAPTSWVLAVDRDSAAQAVQRAETSIGLAYQGVLTAERAGANVSDLLVKLNLAGENLVDAKVALKQENFGAATNLSSICFDISENVKTEANNLRLEANGPMYLNVWLRMTSSILGLTVVGFGGVWTWRIFKKRYYRQVMDMKPEVSSDES